MSPARGQRWSAAQQDTASALERELTARTAWGEPPGLYVIVEFLDFHLLKLLDVHGSLRRGKPEDALASLARDIYAGAAALRGNAPISGLAVRTEGWALTTAPGEQPPQPDTLRADPRRKKTRFIHAIDHTGTAYLATLHRGQDQPRTVIDPPGQPPAIKGAVPAALRLLVLALANAPHPDTGRDTPER